MSVICTHTHTHCNHLLSSLRHQRDLCGCRWRWCDLYGLWVFWDEWGLRVHLVQELPDDHRQLPPDYCHRRGQVSVLYVLFRKQLEKQSIITSSSCFCSYFCAKATNYPPPRLASLNDFFLFHHALLTPYVLIFRSRAIFNSPSLEDLGIFSCVVTNTDNISSSYTLTEEGESAHSLTVETWSTCCLLSGPDGLYVLLSVLTVSTAALC